MSATKENPQSTSSVQGSARTSQMRRVQGTQVIEKKSLGEGRGTSG